MISVIIPALNEAENLGQLLAALQRETVVHEVIVADGRSEDTTTVIAQEFGARVVRSVPGRGFQLAEGARRARGEILLFLHADSVFPKGGLRAIEKMLAQNPDSPGGNFRLLFDGADKFSRWLEGFYAWIRAHGVYYGDSGLFVRRSVYRQLGGIRPMALMEDFDFVRRLEGAGGTCHIEAPPLTTSSRRFEGRHPVMIVCGWFWIHGLYYLRVSPDRLARLYDSARLSKRWRSQHQSRAPSQEPAPLSRQSYS